MTSRHRKRVPPGKDDDVRACMDALRRIVRALRLAATEVERELGLSVAQLFVLQQLADERPRSVTEIAEGTVTDPSTISGFMRRLVDRGLVKRGTSPADGRRAEVTLTPKGAQMLRRAPAAPQTQLVAALSAMPRARRRAIAGGLVELAERLGPAKATFFFEGEATKPTRR
jgi:DNA-binding MarR family transcriptional regulator